MAALPKRKISKQRKGERRAHLALSKVALSLCPECKHKKPPHLVCPNCGTYNGVKVMRDAR